MTGNPSDASTSADNSVLFLNTGVLTFTSAATVDTTEGAVHASRCAARRE